VLFGPPIALSRAGEAGRYGDLRGDRRPFVGTESARAAAERAAPHLCEPLLRYRRSDSLLAGSLAAAASVPATLAELRSQLLRVSAALDRARYAAQGPERALEVLVRHLGASTVHVAVALLLPAARLPVNLAFRAISATLGKPLDLGPPG